MKNYIKNYIPFASDIFDEGIFDDRSSEDLDIFGAEFDIFALNKTKKKINNHHNIKIDIDLSPPPNLLVDYITEYKLPPGQYALFDPIFLDLEDFITPEIDNLDYNPPYFKLIYLDNYPIYFFATSCGSGNYKILDNNLKIGAVDSVYGLLCVSPTEYLNNLISNKKISGFINFAIFKSGYIFDFPQDFIIKFLYRGNILLDKYLIYTADPKNKIFRIWLKQKNKTGEKNPIIIPDKYTDLKSEYEKIKKD